MSGASSPSAFGGLVGGGRCTRHRQAVTSLGSLGLGAEGEGGWGLGMVGSKTLRLPHRVLRLLTFFLKYLRGSQTPVGLFIFILTILRLIYLL